MARNYRSPRSPIGNKGKFGRLVPMHMSLLCPGETLKSHKVGARIWSLPIEFSAVGATIDAWSYIVPLRLIWDTYPEFILGDETQLPAATTQDDRFPATRFVSFGTDAYELIVNSYFRTDEDTAFTYDQASELAALPIVDLTGEHGGSVDYEAEDVTIDVSGGTLSVAEIEEKRAKLAYERKMEAMDGKYLSYLKAQGVNAQEQLVDMPEFIGHVRKYINPRHQIDQSTGFTKQYYAADLDMHLKKKRFISEHSLLVTVICIRPKVLMDTHSSWWRCLTQPEYWPQKGQLREHKDMKFGAEEPGWFDGRASVDDMMFKGDAQVNGDMGSGMVAVFDPATRDAAKYPTDKWDLFCTDNITLGGDDYAFHGFARQGVATPLRDDRIF